jgi:hypothetical protein
VRFYLYNFHCINWANLPAGVTSFYERYSFAAHTAFCFNADYPVRLVFSFLFSTGFTRGYSYLAPSEPGKISKIQ